MPLSKARVSTVFLGLDHNHLNDGPALLFETMIFPEGSYAEMYQRRCSTWEEAEEMHKEAVLYQLGKELSDDGCNSTTEFNN